ncbi:MAG TPA: UbiD family decarboxylase [Micropepsaceae bacterium]|nr:UbiD family decarboxylase [Micropepsaceae bacterium]
MTERKPRAFTDQRGWLDALEAEGELKEITAEVDWNIELGTIMRLAQGTGDGPALLFSNIKDYNGPNARSSQVFGCSLSSYRRVAMLLGLPPDTHPRELVKVARTILQGTIAPKIVKDGPVKENILKGEDVDLFQFPTPHWNRLDGGRYMMTYAGCVTKNPDTGVMNVGVYRGMIADKNHLPIYMYRAQHIGHHALAWQQKGVKEMPIAYVIGWEPSMDFCAGAPVPMGVCEYDVMGAIRGAPVELVKCESHDLYVPATAEIVVEGFLPFDPATHMLEGPFAEFTGYVAGERAPRPTMRVTAITHRNNPVLRGTIEGALPKSFSENAICSSVMRSGIAWNVLDRAGVPGVTDVWGPPVHGTMNLIVQIKQTYRNQAKQVANAIWGSSASHVRYKHVTVVDDDIDIHDYAAVDWAIAYRVNAGENGIVIMPSTFGAGLDPSTRRRDRNIGLFGTGKWNRVLIDATINLDFDPDPDFGGARFPPTAWPSPEDEARARARWKELGLDKKQ